MPTRKGLISLFGGFKTALGAKNMHSPRPLKEVRFRHTELTNSALWMAGLILSVSAIGCGSFEGSEELATTESTAVGVGQCTGAAAQNIPSLPVYTPGNLPANSYFVGVNEGHFCGGNHSGPPLSGGLAEVVAETSDVQDALLGWLGEGEIIMGYVIDNGEHKPVLGDTNGHLVDGLTGDRWLVRNSGHYMAMCSYRNAECLLACNGTVSVCRLGDKKTEAEIRNDCFGEYSAPLAIGSGQCDASHQVVYNRDEVVYNGDCNDISACSAPTCQATITNIALNKPTSQSSTGHGGVSSRAVDGDTNGHYFNNSVTHTNDESGAWWRVDLGSAHSIDRVVIWNRTDCCKRRLKDFYVEYLDQNSNVIESRYFSAKPDPSVTMSVPASGVHAVRVRLTGQNSLSLAEVEVFGCGS